MPYEPENQGVNLETLGAKKAEYVKFEGKEACTWCGGCGDFGIQKALERALVLEGFTTKDVVMVFDIGCNGNGSDKIGGYTFHGLHGRAIPAAAGAALANPKIKVIASGGDGGTLSEGVNHLLHAVRCDYPMVFLLHNNENYGLTVGQASATTRPGQPMTGAPDGVALPPMNACDLVFSMNPSFVARAFSGDVRHMTEVMRRALQHNGFAFIEIMQLCPTFNKATSMTWFWDRIRYVEDLKGYDATDKEKARKAAADIDKEIMMGVLYQGPGRQWKKSALMEEVKTYPIAGLMEQFR